MLVIGFMPPKTPTRLFRWMTDPRRAPMEPIHCLAELEGIAFLRRMDGCPNQAAWDTCEEPFAMFTAVAITNNPDATRLLGHAVLTYRDAVVATLGIVDPMDYPEADLYRNYLATIKGDIGIGGTTLMVLRGHQVLADADTANRALCRWLRLYLPAAPYAFEGFDGVGDDVLLSKLGRCDLDVGERRWVDGLIAKYKLVGKLTEGQRGKVGTLLRLHVGWDFDTGQV